MFRLFVFICYFFLNNFELYINHSIARITFLQAKMSYYDIDDYLAEDEKVSVIFNENCAGLGFLDKH